MPVVGKCSDQCKLDRLEPHGRDVSLIRISNAIKCPSRSRAGSVCSVPYSVFGTNSTMSSRSGASANCKELNDPVMCLLNRLRISPYSTSDGSSACTEKLSRTPTLPSRTIGP